MDIEIESLFRYKMYIFIGANFNLDGEMDQIIIIATLVIVTITIIILNILDIVPDT